MQHLPRMSAAYGFMANPAGLSLQMSQPVPAGVALHPRHTLLPASPITAHATPKLLVSLQAHMFPSQFGLTPGWHEKHDLLRATPVLSLSNVCNTVAFELQCKAGPAWHQLFCKPAAQHKQASNGPLCIQRPLSSCAALLAQSVAANAHTVQFLVCTCSTDTKAHCAPFWQHLCHSCVCTRRV